MNKLLPLLLLVLVFPVVGMESLKQLHDRLTLEDIHRLKNADVQPKGLLCCGAQAHPLVARCKQEVVILEKEWGKEICKELIKQWSHEELKTFIPFFLSLKGEESLDQLTTHANKKLNRAHLTWYNYVTKDLSVVKDLENNKSLDFVRNSLALYGPSSSFPKIRVGNGCARVNIFDGSSYKNITLSKPQFIALFVAMSDKLISCLADQAE